MNRLTLNDLRDDLHRTAKQKGWYEGKQASDVERHMLIVTEIARPFDVRNSYVQQRARSTRGRNSLSQLSLADKNTFLPLDRKYFFSERTQEVFELVCKGLSNKEMEDALCIGEKGVKYHIAKILKASGCRNRRELRVKLGLLS